jgi:phosphatidylglycerophosphate synthase
MAQNVFCEDALTRAEKGFRDSACYILVQPLWILLHLPRLVFTLMVWLMLGEAAALAAWRKVFTPANFLTIVRLGLLAKAVLLFISGESLVIQVNWLFLAIVTDFFDGPMARLNDEVTGLGTYLDHASDWGVAVWAIFLAVWHSTLPLPLLVAGLGVILTLFAVYVSRFLKLYSSDLSLMENVGIFAQEELQTDFWGRIQFVALVAALFLSLFAAVASEKNFILAGLMSNMPVKVVESIVYGAFALFLFLGGYSTQDAISYSELKAKAFKEKLRSLKHSPF